MHRLAPYCSLTLLLLGCVTTPPNHPQATPYDDLYCAPDLAPMPEVRSFTLGDDEWLRRQHRERDERRMQWIIECARRDEERRARERRSQHAPTVTTVKPPSIQLAQTHDSLTSGCVNFPAECPPQVPGEEPELLMFRRGLPKPPPEPAPTPEVVTPESPTTPQAAPTPEPAPTPEVPPQETPWYKRAIQKMWPAAGAATKDTPKDQPNQTQEPAQQEPPPAPQREIIMKWAGPEETPRDPRLPPLPPPDLDQFDTVEAAKKDKGKTPKDKPAPKKRGPKGDLSDLPAVDPHGIIPDVSGFPPGKRPCMVTGIGGEALGLPAGRAGQIRCEYDCGGKPESRFPWGRASEADEICRKHAPTW